MCQRAMTITTTQADFSSPQRYGFPALFEELATQGVEEWEVLKRASLPKIDRELSHHERTALFRAAQNLAKKPETALLAGCRQKVSFYGAYGYALASSETLQDAFRVSRDFFSLSGSVFRISLQIEERIGIWRSLEPQSLGPVLPFVAEYWRSSQTRLFSQIVGQRFPSLHLSFPYRRPKYAHLYTDIFQCPISFESDVMEWRFDAKILKEPCVHADPNVAQLYEFYCEQFVDRSGGKSSFQKEVLRACVERISTSQINAPLIANALNMSVRTFYRRLKDEGIRFQTLVDRLLCSVALEYLNNTDMPVEQVAARCGYQDVSNFRKAFRRWTGRTPSSHRTALSEKANTSQSNRLSL